MKIGDKVRITNKDAMWDDNIYYKGWDLNQKKGMIEDKIEDIPNFDKEYNFKNGDIATVIKSDYFMLEEEYVLETTLLDNDGKIVVCESQSYTMDELKDFCEVIDG